MCPGPIRDTGLERGVRVAQSRGLPALRQPHRAETLRHRRRGGRGHGLPALARCCLRHRCRGTRSTGEPPRVRRSTSPSATYERSSLSIVPAPRASAPPFALDRARDVRLGCRRRTPTPSSRCWVTTSSRVAEAMDTVPRPSPAAARRGLRQGNPRRRPRPNGPEQSRRADGDDAHRCRRGTREHVLRRARSWRWVLRRRRHRGGADGRAAAHQRLPRRGSRRRSPGWQAPPIPRCTSAALPNLRRIHVFGGSDRAWAWNLPEPVADEIVAAAEARVNPGDDHLVIYTSGSTARAEGRDPHPALGHPAGLVHRQDHDWHPGDRVYMPLPYFWIGGYVYGFLAAMLTGATTVCELRFDPPETLASARARARHGHHGMAARRGKFAGRAPRLLAAPTCRSSRVRTTRCCCRRNDACPTRAPGGTPRDDRDRDVAHVVAADEPFRREARFARAVRSRVRTHDRRRRGRRACRSATEGEICVRGTGLMRGVVGRERWRRLRRRRLVPHRRRRLDRRRRLLLLRGPHRGSREDGRRERVADRGRERLARGCPRSRKRACSGFPTRAGQIVCGVVVLRPARR